MIVYDFTDFTDLNIARCEKLFEKLKRYDGQVMTLSQAIQARKPYAKVICDNRYKYNRTKYNRMTCDKMQDEYMAKLKAGRNYNYAFKDESGATYLAPIAKLVFDALDLPIEDRTRA